MGHSHSHNHSGNKTERNLGITIALNLFITIAELIGGFLSGSLSLISDAMHSFSDAIALVIAFAAIRLGKKPKTHKHTFGLKRVEIIAAVINSGTLIIISFFLIKEAVERFYETVPIAGSLMLIVASAGFLANLIGMILMKHGAGNSINIRAAYFHLLSDTVSSIAVIIGAVFIIYFEIYWIDPLLTILISIYILKETYGIIKETADLIMLSTPEGSDPKVIQNEIESIPEIISVHHIHLWRLNEENIHFEAHIEVNDIPVSSTEKIRQQIEHKLHDKFGITHTTLQFECNECINRND